ncbi:MAG: hypothetical protein ACOYN5_14605 [Bacteroidales bacterium]|jgi:hypothetical protein
MKKSLFIALMMVFTLGASAAFANNSSPKSKPETPAITNKTENKLTDEEMSRLTKRIEVIRDMDKSTLTLVEKRELRKELKGIKEKVRESGGYVYIGAGTLVLIIILLIILL